jgi:predicted nucleotidyltransferase component of viral defense system
MERKFDQALHRRHLTALLVGITRAFPRKVAFKGGTCALFFYELPRFSFDLDFDMIEPFLPEDISELKNLLGRHGRVIDWKDKHFTLLGVLDYGAGYPNIKVEINRRVWKDNKYTPITFLGVPLLIADEATIMTNKLVALTDRATPVARDLYDIWYFLSRGFEIKEPLIFERTQESKNVHLKKVSRFIKKTFTTRNVLQGLGMALDDQQKAWVKAHLLEETLRMLDKKISK